ncbi:hypothetical protein SBA2_140010 [Acidobacteriia bacterium SbA2]|nr:hypothetical protein SBA2_140010 [Acidobacteriia bacterium SbA2]
MGNQRTPQTQKPPRTLPSEEANLSHSDYLTIIPPRTLPSEEANLSHSDYLTIIPISRNQSQPKSTSQPSTIPKTALCVGRTLLPVALDFVLKERGFSRATKLECDPIRIRARLQACRSNPKNNRL